MPNYTVTIDVDDFDLGHPTPALAVATFARAAVDSTGTAIVTSAPKSVQLHGGLGLIVLEVGVPYRVQFAGIAGLTDTFYAAATADCTAAQLRQSHQLDPATLNPVAPVPQSVADRLAALSGDLAALHLEIDAGAGIPDLTLAFENGLV